MEIEQKVGIKFTTFNQNAYLCSVKVDITDLKTIKNYAMIHGITPSYIYKLVKGGKMQTVIIDGVHFINTKMFPVIPKK